jgi:flagellar assembly factor FliW
MQINTTRFGTIEISEDKLIHFPLGLLGFEGRQRYLIIDSDEAAPMRWLQCVDEPALAFLVVEPTLFFPDYVFPFSQDDREMLRLEEDQPVVVACTVVIPEDPSQMTINLMGPLVLNPESRIGKQMVLHDTQYSPRQRLIPDSADSEEPALV